MYKTTRNLTVLGIGLGVSAVVGWLLLRENKRQDSDASVTVTSQRRQSGTTESPQIVLPLDTLEEEEAGQADDLTEINGIGPRFAEALQALGITRFEQLSEQDSETLAERMNAYVSITAQRIDDKDWIGQAARLAQR